MQQKNIDLYFAIKNQRKKFLAPVDFCGLASISKNFSHEEYKFLILVSLMLSSQTKDEFTFESITTMIENKILSCDTLSKLTDTEINKIIKKVGFVKTKTKYLRELASNYKNKRLPEDYNTLIQIKGVGNKMAILYMFFACEQIVGISVDTHVHRMALRLKLSDKLNADKCGKDLENLFMKEEWPNINNVLVGFGQKICKAKNPLCELCCISNICPSSKHSVNKNKNYFL